MSKDGVTFDGIAEEYGRRCLNIARERRYISDVQEAMSHPEFKARHHKLVDDLAREFRGLKPRTFGNEPWKSILVGTYPVVKDLSKAIWDSGCRIYSKYPKAMMKKITIADEPKEIELYQASPAELDFPDGARLVELWKRLDELGYEKCSPEVGPQLGLQYTDQPTGECLWVMMDPIVIENGGQRIFSIDTHSSGRFLNGDIGRPLHFLKGQSRIVFCKKN